MRQKFLLFIFSPLFATIITFSPPKGKGSVGSLITFRLEARLEHLPCLLGIENHTLAYEKVGPVSLSAWESLGPGRYRRIITVRLLEKGKGKIKLTYACPVKSSAEEAEIEITERSLDDAYQEARRLLSELVIGNKVNLSYLKITLAEIIQQSAKIKEREKKSFLEKAKSIVEAINKISNLAQEAIEGN